LRNNKNIKILLPIVILVWGGLLYKIFDAFRSDDIILSKGAKSTFIAPTFQKKDTFSLLPIDRDPFLGSMYNQSTANKNNSKKGSIIKDQPLWPTISFFGIVDDKDSKSSVYVININGKQYLLKRGDTLQKLKVLEGSKEAVHIQYKGKTKEFSIM
jgi:type II secretory pathway component PulC